MARPAPPAAIGNPFVGLRRFDIADSALFFGRNEQTYDLLRRLNVLHFIAVIGPSGCGKSSLVRAGVLATLQQGYMAEGGPWKIVMMQPGLDPVGEWKRQLTPYLRQGMDANLLLERPAEALDTSTGKIAILVDQFEELFQFNDRTGRANEVEAFLNAMLSMGAPDGRIYLILTMRSEYLVRCAAYPLLAEAINEGLYLVPRMTRDQLRQAIVAPTQKAGAAITVALIERLLDDASSEEDGLPVLQHALMRMWPHRNPFAPLGLDLYPEAGGLGALLDSHAEQVYLALNADERLVAEAVFRCITERTAEGRVVRRAQQLDTIAKITGISADRLLAVIRRFQSEGFLVVIESDSPLIDISHEAVARQWKRLGVGIWEKREERQEWVEGWIVAEFRERRAVSRLQEAASEWERNARDKSYLFRGPQLQRLELDVGKQRDRAGDSAAAFLVASKKIDLVSKLFSPKVLAAICLLLVIVASAFGFLLYQRSVAVQAEQQAKVAEEEATSSRAKAVEADRKLVVAESALVQNNPKHPTPAAETRPRIYSQVQTDAQEQQLIPVRKHMAEKGYITPEPTRVSVGPREAELRYFRTSEQGKAKEIAVELDRASLKVIPRYVAGFEESGKIRANHFELWLATPAQVAAQKDYAQIVVLFLDPAREGEARKIHDVVSRFSKDYSVSVSPYKAVTWKFTADMELHYFHKEDAPEAEKISGRLQDNGAFNAPSRFMPVEQKIPLRYFEIWLSGPRGKY
jgi:hypothetical protein